MGVTAEGTLMIDEGKKRPDCQNKVIGLFCFGGIHNNEFYLRGENVEIRHRQNYLRIERKKVILSVAFITDDLC